MLWLILIGGVYVVNSSSDASDANVGDGICATSTGECTLRAAVEEAGAQTGMDTILFNVSSVYLNSNLYIGDSLCMEGSTVVDSIFCMSFSGECLSADSYLKMANLYIESKGTGIASWRHLDADYIHVLADSTAVLSGEGRLEIRNSEIRSLYWRGIISYHDTVVVVTGSTVRGLDQALHYYTEGTLSPDTIAGNTFTSDTSVCVSITHNGKNVFVRNNTLTCVRGGIMIYDDGVNAAVPESVFVDSNRIVITGRGAGAIQLNGCTGCGVEANVLEGTDSSGYFVDFVNVKHSMIRYNYNLNDAGRYNVAILESSDSNTVRGNRWTFSSLKDSTGGIFLFRGSDYNVIDSNYISNTSWGGISILDSSSYNYSYLDTLDYTYGIQLRPHWTGNYSFPVYLDTVYEGRVGSGNVFDNVYSYGYYSGMTVAGMDSTLVINSHLKTGDLWGYGIINAGSKVYVRNTLIEGVSTSSTYGGYGISLEYYYGNRAIADEYQDDSLFHISVEGTEFRNLAYPVRVVDIDTSYIKIDTLFDDNNNQITGNTWGDYGPYYLPVVVQTVDNNCNLNTASIDSVTLSKSWGDTVNLIKVNTADALWSFHWGTSTSVDYDALDQWYLMWVLHYDGSGNLYSSAPHYVTIFGENGNTLSTDLTIERGLVNYTDPCPTTGYPKTVDNRWLVIKVQYDPGYLPVSNPEEKGAFRLVIGRYQIPVSAGEVVRVFSPSGRMVKVLRVGGNARIDLQPGLYLVKVSDKTYRIPVF